MSKSRRRLIVKAEGLAKGLMLVLIGGALSACTLKAQLLDISTAEISFIEPSTNSFSNNQNYSFKVKIDSSNPDITAEKAVLQIFENPDCQPGQLVSTTAMNDRGSTAQASAALGLSDGKKYSAQVLIQQNDKTFRSACSPFVGIDTQKPNSVGVTFPTTNSYNSTKEMLAAWTTTTDNGISGMSEVPYRLRLFGQPLCAGNPLKKIDAVSEQYRFRNLTQGVQYSVQVAGVDKAGNESVLSCSPYTEIDVNVPGFNLVDPTSSDTYSRVNTPQVHINNDSQAAYWCFTTDSSFVPTTYTDTCPGGSGSLSGWYTSRPASLPIGSGDGLKVFNLWIVRTDGSLISLNHASGAITLDQTPPGNFVSLGVGGLSDIRFDAWLTSSGQPEVKWAPSTDAVDYTIDIRTSGNALVCTASGVTGTELVFTNCPVLTNGATYKVRTVAFDIARNQTQAPDFDFTVDRDPPGNFLITGITGPSDTNNDAFAGPGNPTVHFGLSSGSTAYQVHIQDTFGVTVCTLGTKADQSGLFNYASESGVACAGLLHGGIYKAYVSALDAGENETQASNNGFSFQIDTVIPDLNLDVTPANPTSNTFAHFDFTADDSLSGFDFTDCQLDGGSYAVCAGSADYAGLGEGSHTVQVRAFDKAGNSTLRSHSWTVDLTNPVLVIDSQPATYTNSPLASIAFHATDVSGIAAYTCSIDSGATGPCTSPLGFTATEGSHTVVIRGTDNVGFYDEKIVSFHVDTTNPVLNLTSVPANPTHSDLTASISFTMNDANAVSASCQIDGGVFNACTSPVHFTGLSAGTHIVNVTATDAAGNSTMESTQWVIYTYTWSAGGFGACSVAQPAWSPGAWGTCSAAQPAYSYTTWNTCSATCGGGTQSRTESCSVVSGTQSRSLSCPVVSGTQTQTVECRRNDSVIVADSYCDAGGKPATQQSCNRGGGTDCVGAAPDLTQACTRGGGTDCSAQQAVTQSCNPQACLTWHISYFPTWTNGTYTGLYCSSSLGYTPVHGSVCTSNGYRCADRVGAGGMQAVCSY